MQWEYRVVSTNFTDGSEGERTLNEFGAEGWELVQEVTRPALTHGVDRSRWIFKRPISGSEFL